MTMMECVVKATARAPTSRGGGGTGSCGSGVRSARILGDDVVREGKHAVCMCIVDPTGRQYVLLRSVASRSPVSTL